MLTVAEIIKDLGGPTAFGRLCGFQENPGARGSDMKQRGSIPVAYWPRVVAEAQRMGKHHITYEVLAHLHSKERAA